jgi:hypothetical protein
MPGRTRWNLNEINFRPANDENVLDAQVMPSVRQLPGTPEQLREQLLEIFPDCRTSYTSIHDDAPSFHSMLTAFSPFVTTALSTCSRPQLLAFANLVNAAVEGGGVLENAFGTCLLEHLGQLGTLKILQPYLSKLAREKTRA